MEKEAQFFNGSKNKSEVVLEQMPERISLNEIWNNLKSSIGNFIEKNFSLEDKEIEEFEKNLPQSIELSKAAGEFYRFLNIKSMNEPDKSYTQEEDNSILQGRLREASELKKIGSKISRVEFKKLRKDIFEKEGYFEEKTQEEVGNFLFQKGKRNIKQKNSRNKIEEEVVNFLGPEGNLAKSSLVFDDAASGKMLDLGQLLPNNFNFFPVELRKTETKKDEESGKASLKIIPVDLKTYKGADRASDKAFSANKLFKKVMYGNLANKGGMLSLLHEIAHAWQGVYYEEFGKVPFENYFYEIVRNLSVLSYFKKEVSAGKIDAQTFEKAEMPRILKELEQLGVQINKEDFSGFRYRKLEKDEYRVKGLGQDELFLIKTKKLDRLIKGYEREERDAWAHAIRVVRFLRERGVDVEPNLKTLKDFKDIVDPCLNSYQKYMEKIVYSPDRKIKFLHSSQNN